MRLYGIPLHAWNESFQRGALLRLYGRYLCTNNCSLEKERFDYSRVLVVTSSPEIVSLVVFTYVFGKLRASSDYYKRDRTRNLKTCYAKVLIIKGFKKGSRDALRLLRE